MSQTLLAFRKLAIAMLKLDKIQANKIVEKLMADIPYNINIMDERGKIIASGDSARIGERHRGAERAINERKNIEIYKDTSLEKKAPMNRLF